MSSRSGSVAAVALKFFLAAIVLVVVGIPAGIGVHRVVHLRNATDALAHDPGCTTNLRLTTPAHDASGACRVVHGTVRRAYRFTYGTNSVYQYHVVFAPQNGGQTVDVDLGTDLADEIDVYRAARDRPGRAAVAEYVDGEVDYFADDAGTIGPIFDPESDEDFRSLIVAAGVFFAVIGAVVLIPTIVAGRSRKNAARR
jgi:hypothetical protein